MDSGPMQCNPCGTKPCFAIHVGTPPEVITFHQDKKILCRHSEVFSKMIQSDFKEGKEGEVTITDFQPLTVQSMLRFLNSEKLADLSCFELVDLVKLAHQYQVHALIEACEKKFAELLYLENVYVNLKLASLLNLQILRKTCLETITSTAFVSLRRPGFSSLSREDVWDIVSSNDLLLDTEMTVVEALWQWGGWECSRKGLSVTDQNICTTLNGLTAAVRRKDLREDEISRMSPSMRDILTINEEQSRSINFNREWCLLPLSSSITLKGKWTYPSEEPGSSLIEFTLTKPAFLTGMKLEYCDKTSHCCPALNDLSLYQTSSNGFLDAATKILLGTTKELHWKEDVAYMEVYVTFLPPVLLTPSSMFELKSNGSCTTFITWPELDDHDMYVKCLDDSNELLTPFRWARGVRKLYVMPV